MPSATPSSALSQGKIPLVPSKRLPALTPRKRCATPKNTLPVPETPALPLPPDISSYAFREPKRHILSPQDHECFLRSSSYTLVVSFIFSLSESCADTPIPSVTRDDQLPIIHKIISTISSITSLVEENPPQDQGSSRFGNPAFRSFMDAVSAHLDEYHSTLGLPNEAAVLETSTYLAHSFGSRERIDYGSGHELNFILWLLCLNRLSLLPPSTFPALALLVLPNYICLLRKLQSTYYLEPAGSHGVWGLDDYHFLPFLFGSSQLLHHPYIRPLSIHNELVLEEEGDRYMYLDMVRYTMDTKTVRGLKWTQPMLDDISGAKNWEKVEQGMRRMFVKEVLGKLPVMQHFLFGSLIPAVKEMGSMNLQEGHDALEEAPAHTEIGTKTKRPGHVHRDDNWGDCCGIKIPSTIAAAQEAKKSSSRQEFRRVPFD
ncbi:Serine/threonine-protein phosphatase 2A activator 2 [Ptychographa xylographoides]|nr:Serine/threonine-protein phosphatase 2A activator 2 [Ptychographa xylographoides]